MTTPANGAVPPQFLAAIGNGLAAERNTAAAYQRLVAAHPAAHTNGAASAYWNRSLDVDIHAHPENYNISPSEAKALSSIGHSPHGLGTRLNFSGVTEAVAAQFGFRPYRNAYTFDYAGVLSWDQGPLRTARVNTRIRDAASTLGNQVGELTAGQSIQPSGYVDALQYPGGIADGTSIWFYVVGIGYYCAAEFTDPTITGLYNGNADYAQTHPLPTSAPPPADTQPPTPTIPDPPTTPDAPSTTQPADTVADTPKTPTIPVDSNPTPTKEPAVNTPKTPIVDPDLNQLDPALGTLTTAAIPYIPKAARATVYTIGILIGVVAAAVGPVFGGETAIVFDAITKAALAVTGALALSNVK